MISCLQAPNGTLRELHQIKEHVYDFYRDLLGSEAPRHLVLASNTWAEDGRVSDAENEALLLTFSEIGVRAYCHEYENKHSPWSGRIPSVIFQEILAAL